MNEKSYLECVSSHSEYTDTIGLDRRIGECLENHISPDGKHILVCTTEGLKIYKFYLEMNKNFESKVLIKPTEWNIPFKTDDIKKEELASRVKFESSSVIRFLTRDKRDILYRLDNDGRNVYYIGEVKVDNLLKA